VSFAVTTLYVASQRVFIVVSVYFVIDSVWKLSDIPSYVDVLSGKGARYTPRVWGVSFVYRLYRIGDSTEPCGTPSWIARGMGI
jgi:hypothetical protein